MSLSSQGPGKLSNHSVSAAMFLLKVNPAGMSETYSHKVREPPYLRIIEQPQTHYKFRYKTEMESSHGCLYGKSYEKNKTEKTYPEVELVNYDGRARITCTLVEADSHKEHPHSLHSNDQNQQFTVEVPEHNSYKVRFPGLCIVHTAVKKVPQWLFETKDISGLNQTEINKLHRECAIAAKNINLNVLRLKFSAHNAITNEIICEPVFSDHINNLRSPATNILKICRMSKHVSRAQGGDDVYMLVEKVVKKNIKIRFFEVSDDGREVWQDYGRFVDSDVHHQYAIVFRTPPYRDINIVKSVTVYVELVRQSDGQKSEPKTFCYAPSKKRKVCYDFDTPPRTPKYHLDNKRIELNIGDSEQVQSCNEVQQSIYYGTSLEPNHDSGVQVLINNTDPILSQTDTLMSLPYEKNNNNNYDCAESIAINDPSTSFQNSISEPNLTSTWDLSCPTGSISTEKDGLFIANDLYVTLSLDDMFDEKVMQFLQEENNDNIVPDSGGQKNKQSSKPLETRIKDEAIVKKMTNVLKSYIKTIPAKSGTDYNSEMMKQTLEELFKLRLSNGDNFLHMALISKQPLLRYIISSVHHFDMEHLLNMRNDRMQTILHLAIANDMPEIISFLISKGCDPMLEDVGGNNAFHYTLMCQSSLSPLFNAIKGSQVSYDLDAFNYEKQTALHLSVIYKDAAGASQLLKVGSNYKVQDNEGRTPLHLAAYDDCPSVARALLAHMHPDDVNVEDSLGYSALQIVCNGHLRENTVDMIILLLEHKADPMKEGRYKSAWHLAKNKRELREIMIRYLLKPRAKEEDSTTDEFESADDASDSEICIE